MTKTHCWYAKLNKIIVFILLTQAELIEKYELALHQAKTNELNDTDMADAFKKVYAVLFLMLYTYLLEQIICQFKLFNMSNLNDFFFLNNLIFSSCIWEIKGENISEKKH